MKQPRDAVGEQTEVSAEKQPEGVTKGWPMSVAAEGEPGDAAGVEPRRASAEEQSEGAIVKQPVDVVAEGATRGCPKGFVTSEQLEGVIEEHSEELLQGVPKG